MILRRILEAVAKRLPERRIVVKGELYLQRYYLFGRMPDDLAALWNCGDTPRERLGFLPTTYLHHFHRPDADRDCHNHPWHGRGVVLVGGYIEERWLGYPGNPESYKAMVVRKPFAEQNLEPHTYHRIDTLLAPTVWTLFWVGKQQQTWGYWSEDLGRHVPWRERHADSNTD